MKQLTHGSLFSGIGGFDLAADWMGWENVFHCEWNPFGRKVLNHYWPNAISYEDITKTDFNVWRGRIDILTGGFPCQPYSQAGLRKGKEDSRHLWPEMLRAIREIQPGWVVGENVPGIANWKRGMVVKDIKNGLEAEGFKVLPPFAIPAGAVGAIHRRERLWFCAYSKSVGSREQQKQNTKPGCFGGIDNFHKAGNKYEAATRLCALDDGIPGKLAGITLPKWRKEALKGAGNAIVPQIAFEIFKAIESTL